MKKIRVLLVDDQALVREGLAAIFSYQTEIEVVGQLRYIELWSPARHAAAQEEWRAASRTILDEIL